MALAENWKPLASPHHCHRSMRRQAMTFCFFSFWSALFHACFHFTLHCVAITETFTTLIFFLKNLGHTWWIVLLPVKLLGCRRERASPKFEMFLLLKVVVMVAAGLTVVDNDTWACHLLWGCTHNTCHGRYLKERLLLSGVGGYLMSRF